MERRWRSMALALALVAAVVSTGLASAGAQDAGGAAPPPPTITWGPCTDETLVAFGAECGTLSVPLDHGRPWGEQVQLAVSRVRHTVPDAQDQGIMLVNPGGPGGSGLIYSILGAFVPGGVGTAYDWIGFDPRGVGSSTPTVSCDPDYMAGPRPPYEPTTEAIEHAWAQMATAYAIACQANGLQLLDHLKTTGSLEVRKRFPQASLIATVGGPNHANSLFGGVACVDDAVAAYLLDGRLPPRVAGKGPDATCEPAPDPEPVAVAALRQSAVPDDALRQLQPTGRAW